EDRAANYDKVRRLLSAAQPEPGALVVLPEMFATGFTMNLALAEDTVESIAATANEYRVRILAGIVRDRRNEAVLFDAQGREFARYAKMHPFKFAGETAEPGNEPAVVDCGEFKLAPAVCYDLR